MDDTVNPRSRYIGLLNAVGDSAGRLALGGSGDKRDTFVVIGGLLLREVDDRFEMALGRIIGVDGTRGVNPGLSSCVGDSSPSILPSSSFSSTTIK
jgi:hypothetical protein